MAQEITIVGGPSKFDLLNRLFNATRLFSPVDNLMFRFKDGTGISFGLLGVEKEDGSGESWIVKFTPDFDVERFGIRRGTPHRVHYNTNTRKGTLYTDKV